MTERCRSYGQVEVFGRKVAMLRCELDAGHELIGSESGIEPHRHTLEWRDPAVLDWPEATDPDEHFDAWIPVDGEDQG